MNNPKLNQCASIGLGGIATMSESVSIGILLLLLWWLWPVKILKKYYLNQVCMNYDIEKWEYNHIIMHPIMN